MTDAPESGSLFDHMDSSTGAERKGMAANKSKSKGAAERMAKKQREISVS
ncbi:MAG: hypothetical protein ACYTG5_12645 [Planctomycetota bacterium]|jgi:hypothetical protein